MKIFDANRTLSLGTYLGGQFVFHSPEMNGRHLAQDVAKTILPGDRIKLEHVPADRLISSYFYGFFAELHKLQPTFDLRSIEWSCDFQFQQDSINRAYESFRYIVLEREQRTNGQVEEANRKREAMEPQATDPDSRSDVRDLQPSDSGHEGPNTRPHQASESGGSGRDRESETSAPAVQRTASGQPLLAEDIQTVLDFVETCCRRGRFEIVDRLLPQLDPSTDAPSVILAVLTITSYGKEHLPNREAFVARCNAGLMTQLGATRAEALLKNRR